MKCMNAIWAECQATSGVRIVTTLLQTVKYSKSMTYKNVGCHNSKALSCGLVGLCHRIVWSVILLGPYFQKK